MAHIPGVSCTYQGHVFVLLVGMIARQNVRCTCICTGEGQTQETPALLPRLPVRLTQQLHLQRSPWATPDFPRPLMQACPEPPTQLPARAGDVSLCPHDLQPFSTNDRQICQLFSMSEGQNVIPRACRLHAGHASASPARDSPDPVCGKRPRAVPYCRFVKWRHNYIVHHNPSATRSLLHGMGLQGLRCLRPIHMSFFAGTAYSQAPEHVCQHDETHGDVLASLPSPAIIKMQAMVATPYQQTGDPPL